MTLEQMKKYQQEFEKLYKGKLDLTIDSTLPLNYNNNKTNWAWSAYCHGRQFTENEMTVKVE